MNVRRTRPTPDPVGFDSHRLDSERGAALIMALAVMLAIGLILAGILGFLNTSFRTSASLQSGRNAQYAADGAVQQAIRTVQTDTPAALLGATCGTNPYFNLTSNGLAIRVDCQGLPTTVTTNGQTTLLRNVVFLACRFSDPATRCAESSALLIAKVNFPTNAAGTVTGAFVQSWSVTR